MIKNLVLALSLFLAACSSSSSSDSVSAPPPPAPPSFNLSYDDLTSWNWGQDLTTEQGRRDAYTSSKVNFENNFDANNMMYVADAPGFREQNPVYMGLVNAQEKTLGESDRSLYGIGRLSITTNSMIMELRLPEARATDLKNGIAFVHDNYAVVQTDYSNGKFYGYRLLSYFDITSKTHEQFNYKGTFLGYRAK